MRKTLLTAIVMVGCAMVVNAQDFHFGAKAGVNFASINGDDSDLDGTTSFHVGAVAELGLTDKFAIQPELIYSAQGADVSGVDSGIDYLNLPVLAELKLSDNFSLQAGPQFGFVIDEGDFQDLESFDLSAALGAEANFGKFFAQARYNLGFTDIAEDADAKNGVFQISIGYWFL